MQFTESRQHLQDDRIQLCDNGVATLLLEGMHSSAETQTLDAKVVDISQRGVRLEVRSKICENRRFWLQLRIPEIDKQIYLVADTCWCHESGVDTYQIGCELTPVIPAKFFAMLTRNGHLDRARDNAANVDQHLRLVVESNQNARGVIVRDHSANGFCLESNDRVPLGESLCLYRDGDGNNSIRASAQWQIQWGDTYLIGLRVLDGQSDINQSQSEATC